MFVKILPVSVIHVVLWVTENLESILNACILSHAFAFSCNYILDSLTLLTIDHRSLYNAIQSTGVTILHR